MEPAAACEAAVRASAWEEAAPLCQAALDSDPEAFGLHYFLAFAHQGRGDWGPAADAFEAFAAQATESEERAQRMDAQIRAAVRAAGVARFREGRMEAAIPLLRRATEADAPDAEVWFWLGAALRRTGDPAGAEAAYETVVREAPDVPDAWFFLAQLRYEAGDHEAAGGRLERYLEVAPDGAFRSEAHWMAASIALRRLDPEGEPDPSDSAPTIGDDQATHASEAARHFAAYLEGAATGESVTDAARAALAHYFLGRTAEEADRCAEARRHYESFLELAPEDERAPEVRTFLSEGLACEVSPPARAGDISASRRSADAETGETRPVC